ncbi:Ribonuclease PH [Candidatus Kinetoplastibacterium sorsogonicusi]|uniref:Ribonuclease PH n=1 Tax=Candidatus Kinetoplastidibacterium kentomonadis TaxID=1576550 RepID=A0A3S7J9S6_9PROT|nr:ribonuclease PH [Candidatus Kinetoplastibacterium sorsogonicusi]AWD32416.1 Ribonuclease PH [Candidatus Kinetoplastibacterium sorsogonicusi]
MNNSIFKRQSGRYYDQLREIKITHNFTKNADSSVLIEMGNTKVLCNATILNKVPNFINEKQQGWITAEYSMIPSSTLQRNIREVILGEQSGRSKEIQRLIGRAIRSSVNLKKIHGKTIHIDCDVLNADGGTRCASITGGFIATYEAIKKLDYDTDDTIKNIIAAVSVGKLNNNVLLLDMDYSEDSSCEVDLNIVMNNKGDIIEIQGSSEKNQFSRNCLNKMLDLAFQGINQIINHNFK